MTWKTARKEYEWNHERSLGKWLVMFLVLWGAFGFSKETAFALTPTAKPTTPLPTIIPSSTLYPTQKPSPWNTVIDLTLLLHGIGRGGDNANSVALGNTTPLHPQRRVSFEVYNSRSELLMFQEGTITYNPGSGNFTGYVDLGPGFPSGTYSMKVKTNKYLKKQLGTIVTITKNVKNALPAAALIAGDTNGDNKINILDYNQLVRCYNAALQRRLCTSVMEQAADLNDDGKVDGVDYNLFLREVWIQPGQ